MSGKIQKYIDKNKRDCVLLRQSLWEESPRRSWFGGYPLRPEGQPWPQHSEHGDMPFLAQIDLAELSAAGVDMPKGLPHEGLLAFYFDLTSNDYGLSKLPVVEYIPSNTRVVEQKPTAPLREKGEYDTVFYGAVFNFLFQNGPKPMELDHYPKYAMDMIPAEDCLVPLEMIMPNDNEWDSLKSYLSKKALLAHYGEAVIARREKRICENLRVTDPTVFLDPEWNYSFASVYERSHFGQPDLTQNFPRTWGGVRLAFTNLFPNSKTWGDSQIRSILETQKQAQAWIEKATQHDPFERVDASDRVAFIKWFRARWEFHMKRSIMPPHIIGRKRLSILWSIRSRLVKMLSLEATLNAHTNVEQGLRRAIYACRDDVSLYCNGVTGCGPMDTAERELIGDLLHESASHKTLGYGHQNQYPSEEHRDKILLFEADSATSLMWMFADVGMYQVWISPQHLKAQRWEKAFATLEGG